MVLIEMGADSVVNVFWKIATNCPEIGFIAAIDENTLFSSAGRRPPDKYSVTSLRDVANRKKCNLERVWRSHNLVIKLTSQNLRKPA